MTLLKLVMHGLRMLMPFADRIAIRGLVLFSSLVAGTLGFGCWVLAVRLFSHRAIPGWATYTILLAIVICVVALTSIVLLFTLFVQSQSISMSNIDTNARGNVDAGHA